MHTPEVHIYTDGAARGNPGPGGFGIVMEWVGKPYKKEFAQGFKLTTNNRMELMAVIVAISKLKNPGTQATVFTDSKYVADAVNKGWVFGWEKKNFVNRKNSDLWKAFLKVYRRHKVKFQWIKGHNDHPQNERCDALAVIASKGKNLLEDTGYKA
ncbi:ribonuclease HI [Gramella sp. MT6]|uniref:ribonuclease HI n=1 Tax=Gramella sp. MT6 TaxID=2705471 RepID=UPI001C5EF731|nr:ribonuclease HI [Gramella sp. MT6]QYA24798.1 ribonuclease HI [Gramella sp. MT6]